jgi:hypothetical protein
VSIALICTPPIASVAQLHLCAGALCVLLQQRPLMSEQRYPWLVAPASSARARAKSELKFFLACEAQTPVSEGQMGAPRNARTKGSEANTQTDTSEGPAAQAVKWQG